MTPEELRRKYPHAWASDPGDRTTIWTALIVLALFIGALAAMRGYW